MTFISRQATSKPSHDDIHLIVSVSSYILTCVIYASALVHTQIILYLVCPNS